MLHISLFRDSQVSFVDALRQAGVEFAVDATQPNSNNRSLTEIDVRRTPHNLDRLADVVIRWRVERPGRLVMMALDSEKVTEAAKSSAKELAELFAQVSGMSVVEIPNQP